MLFRCGSYSSAVFVHHHSKLPAGEHPANVQSEQSPSQPAELSCELPQTRMLTRPAAIAGAPYPEPCLGYA